MENWCCSCLASLKTSSKNFNEEINCGKKERRTKECKYIYQTTSHVQKKSMRVCSLPLKLLNQGMQIYLLLAIRLWKSWSEICILQNTTYWMKWLRQTNSKNNTKTFDLFKNFTKCNESLYAKNAPLNVAKNH